MGTAKSAFIWVAVLQLFLALVVAWQFAPRIEVCIHRSMGPWEMLRFVDWQVGAGVLILAAVTVAQYTWVRAIVAVIAGLNFASLFLGLVQAYAGPLDVPCKNGLF